MIDKLQTELLKAQDNLQTIEFKINDEQFTFYYRYMTLLEKTRIEQMCVKPYTEVKEDGTKKVTYEKQEHLIPIHTMLEKALDKDGKRLFSHTKKQDFDIISKLPVGVASYIAYEMSLDIFGTLEVKDGTE